MSEPEASSYSFPKSTWIWQNSKHNESLVAPTLQKIEGVDDYEHGTYESRPCYSFLKSSTGKNYLLSDTGLQVELIFIPEEEEKTNEAGSLSSRFKLAFLTPELVAKFPNAELTYNAPETEEDHTFVVRGTGDFAHLPSSEHPWGHYACSNPRDDNAFQVKESFGDVFTHKVYAFEMLLKGWDVTAMNMDDFKKKMLPRDLFMQPDGETSNYKQDGNVVTPYGWFYDTRNDHTGREYTTTLSSTADVMNSVRKAAGFNLSGGVSADLPGIFKASEEFSVTQNKAVKDKIGNMYAKEVSHSEHTYVETEWAFVLDKMNVKLNDLGGDVKHHGEKAGFRKAISEMQRELKSKGQLSEKYLFNFLKDWGTHYVYAATFGAKGQATVEYKKDEVKQLVEKEVDIKNAWSLAVSLEVFGIGGNLKAGEDSESNEAHHSQLGKVKTKTWQTYSCVGGGTCDKGKPGQGDRVPIYLDLRPISELFGPPFFTDELTAITLREQLSDAITNYAFTAKAAVTPRSKVFHVYEMDFGPVKIEIDPEFRELGNVWTRGPDIIMPSGAAFSFNPFNTAKPQVLAKRKTLPAFKEMGVAISPDRFGMAREGGTKVLIVHDPKAVMIYADFRFQFGVEIKLGNAPNPNAWSGAEAAAKIKEWGKTNAGRRYLRANLASPTSDLGDMTRPLITLVGGWYERYRPQQMGIEIYNAKPVTVSMPAVVEIPAHLRAPGEPAEMPCGTVSFTYTFRPVDLEQLLTRHPGKPIAVPKRERKKSWKDEDEKKHRKHCDKESCWS